MKIGILGICAWISLLVGLGLFFADNLAGDDSLPYPGRIVDKIYRPAYTTQHYVRRAKGHGRWETRYHPATYHIEVAAPDTVFSWNLFRDTFYRVTVGQPVTCTKRFGKWTGMSYGWRVASFNSTILMPEKSK